MSYNSTEMKTLTLFVLASLFSLAAELKLGKPFTLAKAVTVAEVVDQPEAYVGKTLQVKGKITEVCQMAGCWVALSDPQSGQILRVKVNDGEIVFPKESTGKRAVAEGVLKKFDLTRDQAVARARHEAEEQGRKFNPNSVKGGATVYQLMGSGAVIVN